MNELLLIATVAGRRCAFYATRIRSVIEIGKITPIPGTADMVLGLAGLRSKTLIVIDCARVVGETASGHEGSQLPADARAAVVDVDGYAFALAVDSIEDITETVSEVGTVLGGFGKKWANAAHGMVETSGGPALLLNIEQFVSCTTPTDKAA